MSAWLLAFGVAIIGTFATAVVFRWDRSARRRPHRAVRRLKTTAIAALKLDERAKIAGVAAPRGDLLTSPISGQPCIGYQVMIDTETSGGSYVVLVKREACGVFTVTDDTGSAVIDGPYLLALDGDHGGGGTLPPAVVTLLQEELGPRASAYVDGRLEVHFGEALLKPGDRVAVLGRATLERDPAGRGSYREPPMSTHISGTERKPVVIIDEDDAVRKP